LTPIPSTRDSASIVSSRDTVPVPISGWMIGSMLAAMTPHESRVQKRRRICPTPGRAVPADRPGPGSGVAKVLPHLRPMLRFVSPSAPASVAPGDPHTTPCHRGGRMGWWRRQGGHHRREVGNKGGSGNCGCGWRCQGSHRPHEVGNEDEPLQQQ
jgi:hypothetical protein